MAAGPTTGTLLCPWIVEYESNLALIFQNVQVFEILFLQELCLHLMSLLVRLFLRLQCPGKTKKTKTWKHLESVKSFKRNCLDLTFAKRLAPGV